MAEATRLSIDFWHTTVCAAVGTPQGQIMAVTLDGAAVSPNAVAVDADTRLHVARDGAHLASHHPHAYVRVPGLRLLDGQVRVGAVQVDPVELVAATLSRLAQEVQAMIGAAPPDVVIGVPAAWVARQRRGIEAAAIRAGLGPSTVVNAVESIVREQIHRGAMVPIGSVVVVCRLDLTAGELVLLHCPVDGFEPIAVIDLGEVGETPGATLTEQAATALTQALDATATATSQVTAVFCQVPEAMMRELSDALLTAADLPISPTPVADLAAAFGAVRPAQPHPTPAAIGPSPGGFARPMIAAAVALSAAVVLTYQVFTSATAHPIPAGGAMWLDTAMYGWALVPVFATLAAVSAALLASHTPPHGRDPTLGSALILIAALGLGGAGAIGLIGAQHFGTQPAPLLGWTLTSTAPLALVLIGLGLVVGRTGPPPRPSSSSKPLLARWRDHLMLPLPALALAAVSTVALVAAAVGEPTVDPALLWQMQHIGAFLIGWAIAFLLPVNPWRRITIGSLLAITSAYAIGEQTAGAISSCLVAAITLWWLLRLTPILAPGARP